MYRLTVIAGPGEAKGSSYDVTHDRLRIGRHSDNEIVLPSGNVSKKHCILVVSNGRVLIQDQGSSNGTFVNGKLSTQKEIRPGDHLSVGEYTFELKEVKAPSQNVIPFQKEGAIKAVQWSQDSSSTASPLSAEPHAKELPGQIKKITEGSVLPFFYNFLSRYQWKSIVSVLILAFLVLNLVISINPILEAYEKGVRKEVMRRAQWLVKELVDRNQAVMTQGQESKIEIGILDKEPGVMTAAIIDLEQRVIAPATQAGQSLVSGPVAIAVSKSKKEFVSGYEKTITGPVGHNLVVSVEPIKIYSQKLARPELVGMAVVALDTTHFVAGEGEMSLVYGSSLIISVLLGCLFFYIIYRLTFKPVETLMDQLDRSLRGDVLSVHNPYHFSELDKLWNLTDSALKRIPQGGHSGEDSHQTTEISSADIQNSLRTLVASSKDAIVLLDEEKRVQMLNGLFEEITGIREDASLGQQLTQVSRDQAFAAMIQDLLERTQPGSQGVVEDFDFSGMGYKIYCTSIGASIGGHSKAYILWLIKNDG